MPLAQLQPDTAPSQPVDLRLSVLRRRIKASSEPVERLIADLAFGQPERVLPIPRPFNVGKTEGWL